MVQELVRIVRDSEGKIRVKATGEEIGFLSFLNFPSQPHNVAGSHDEDESLYSRLAIIAGGAGWNAYEIGEVIKGSERAHPVVFYTISFGVS
ncbi:hypothetical protein HY448_01225 [Candidatus Pacearchaeota archaeon]|nr:hypothetical protein [Candidatus Pacearchaeota archaeon]